jgi:beta-galactosidase/beta-glucuronidase
MAVLRMNEAVFQIDIDNRGEQEGWFASAFDKSDWLQVNIPGAWDFYGHAYWGYEGIGWYCLKLEADQTPSGRNYRLQFERVSGHAKVWVNGELVGEHIGSFLPFEWDITSCLQATGTNQIVVRVDNVPRRNWLPGSMLIEWIQYGGILQPVSLVANDRCLISNVAIDAAPVQDGAAVVCQIEVTNTGETMFEGEIRLGIDANNTAYTALMEIACPAGQKIVCSATIDMALARLWSPESPQLYEMQVEMLGHGEQVVDGKIERFGVRTIKVQGTQILLNGEPILIKGVNRYDDIAGYGPTVPEEDIRADLLKAKQAGVNCIRTHYPLDTLHLNIMDEIGLLLINEIPLNWWLKPWEIDAEVDEAENNDIIDRAETELQAMIKHGRNHPCIIAWSMCNESGTNKPYGIQAMRRLMSKAKEIDPTRLVTFVAVGHTPGHQAFADADIVSINLYYGSVIAPLVYHMDQLEEHAAAPTAKHLRETVSEFAGKPVIVTEFGAQSIASVQGDLRYSEALQAAYIQSVWRAIRSVEGVQGGILWCWADYYHRSVYAGPWQAPFGAYGVVTVDRQDKLSLGVLSKLFNEETDRGRA